MKPKTQQQNQQPSQPAKPQKNYLQLSDQELDKLAKFKQARTSIPVDKEWLEIAEFGYYYGFTGIQTILNDEIDIDTVQMLLAASRKVWAGQALDIAQATFAATASAQAKKPSTAFKKSVKGFIDRMKVET